jgi:molecular chaperone DnaJ
MRAREVKVRVPAGVTDGQRIRVKGRGAAGASGGPAGDLFVVVRVQSHPLFGRSGNDVTIRLPVTFAEATLGADVKVPTLDGQVTMRIPAGTPSGKVMRVRGQGVAGDAAKDDAAKTSKNGKGGDLLVTIEVVVPNNLEAGQREAVEALGAAFPEDPRAELFAKQQNRRSSDG